MLESIAVVGLGAIGGGHRPPVPGPGRPGRLSGEFLSVIGPSGCGKTTTMLIAGLEQPDAGQILVRGQHIEGVPAYERNVGLVFQLFVLFPHPSVIENV